MDVHDARRVVRPVDREPDRRERQQRLESGRALQRPVARPPGRPTGCQSVADRLGGRPGPLHGGSSSVDDTTRLPMSTASPASARRKWSGSRVALGTPVADQEREADRAAGRHGRAGTGPGRRREEDRPARIDDGDRRAGRQQARRRCPGSRPRCPIRDCRPPRPTARRSRGCRLPVQAAALTDALGAALDGAAELVGARGRRGRRTRARRVAAGTDEEGTASTARIAAGDRRWRPACAIVGLITRLQRRLGSDDRTRAAG